MRGIRVLSMHEEEGMSAKINRENIEAALRILSKGKARPPDLARAAAYRLHIGAIVSAKS